MAKSNLREHLLARGYWIMYHEWVGEYFIFSPRNILMGCGFTESEAWGNVARELIQQVQGLFEEAEAGDGS
jgi:hypothetical protein